MKKVIFIKLGGSLITDKTKPFTARFEVIDNLCLQISEALKEIRGVNLIIGNGGGSFPHYSALKYKIKDKIKTEKEKLGFCEIQHAARSLNRIIIDRLIFFGVKAISVNPSSFIIAKKNQIKKIFLLPLLNFLEFKLIPVIYGDIIYDEVLGGSIFSTERLINQLAVRLIKEGYLVHKIIHSGETPGVLDAQGNLIPKITKNFWRKYKSVIKGSKGFDVTGGMKHKVEEALKLASQYKIKTLILNGINQKDLLKKAITTNENFGTLIE